ncbi:MAG: 16S rRNA (cytosine(1402)-N(4))-methyltransferase RsmH [Muribaculaceae bacterium]|nr:16S rRNA (cytosine(1402)-N(4))-methyltransferase RsmH [Muribaculaceae bacterium]MBR3831673.1 16S rRNA (cytosine(1402)-N(4))-methyltransferase RsmH [Muribaculaceae bacterium]
MEQEVYHIPALLPETLSALDIKPDGVYVDVTFGGGGHSRAIVDNLGEAGHLYSFDQDEDAVKRAFTDPRFTIVYSNFRYLSNFMQYHKVEGVDGILADLGVSFHHFDDKDRGFSFRFEGALDMRMNQKAKRTAAWILANYTESQLADVFYLYGELKNSRKIASVIVKARNVSPIETIEQFLEVVKPLVNPRQEKKELAMMFQALRIEVNGEIDVLKRFLKQALDELKPGGRLAIITYHSLEDRLVKNFMKTGNLRGEQEKDFFGRSLSPFKLLTSKPIVPSAEEIERNPRSRSAKLRVALKL